jgi:hypothetical protein
MAWLSVVSGSGGVVPFSNITNTGFRAQACDYSGTPFSDGLAQVVAGPALDQMQHIGDTWDFSWYNDDPSWAGYFDMDDQLVPAVSPGQTIFYRVDISYPNPYGPGTYTQQSTVLALVAGGGTNPTPSAGSLKFPIYIEWPDPPRPNSPTPINQVQIPGETVSLTNGYFACTDFGTPTAQWRKNGNPIIGATNFPNIAPGYSGPHIVSGTFQGVLTITNVQPADAGIYDLVVIGNNWIVGPKTVLSIQITGYGVLQSPRFVDTNFVCDLLGAAGRNYAIQWSTNLTDWHNFTTQYNSTGTITFSNAPASGDRQFYRGRLLP